MIKEIVPFYSALSVCFILLWFIKKNSGFGKQITRCYVLSIVSTIVLCAADMGELYFATLDHPTIYRIICSSLGYLCRSASIYFIFLITIRNTKKLFKFILTIPLLINLLVVILPLVPISSELVFYFDEENVFVRSYLGFVPFIISGFYMLCFLIRISIGLGKSNRKEIIAILVISMNVFISVGLTLLLESELYLCNGVASSIAFYYLYFHTALNNEDLLTGAYVRRKLFVDCEVNERKVTGLISLDINSLTEINNKYGIDKGDETLRTFSKVVSRTLNKQMKFYRTGGDEFAILCLKMTEEEIVKYIEMLNNTLSNASCETAIGYAMYDMKRGIDFAIRLADRDMYSNKKAMKAERGIY